MPHPPQATEEAPPPLRAVNLGKTYSRRAPGGGRQEVKALDGVDLTLREGQIVALVGESGGGKSTLARCLALLEAPTTGEIWVAGHCAQTASRRQLAAWRPSVQLIFQDPAAAINPRFNALETVAEPLYILRQGNRRQQLSRARELMAEVGLAPELATRSSFELSGGQRQRLAIARALAADPRVLILDEGLASLDLSLRAQIVNMLLVLQSRFGLSYLLISHDLRTVAHLADEVAVLDHGQIVERAAPADLLAHPSHPKTRELTELLRGSEASGEPAAGGHP